MIFKSPARGWRTEENIGHNLEISEKPSACIYLFFHRLASSQALPCLLLCLFPVLVDLSRIHLLCLHLNPHFDLSLSLVLVPLKVDTKSVNPVPMYLSHALTVSQNLFQNDRDRMTARWRQRMMKREGEKTIQRDGSASHQPFSFTPAWGNQPSIMHHMSPSNSREPSNRILATATNYCLFRCWPIGEPCFWSAPANRDERGW